MGWSRAWSFLNFQYNPEIQISYKNFKWDNKIVKAIYSVGLPSIIMQSIGSVMTYAMNLILIGFSTTATAVFGVYFKLQSFIFMPVFGLNNGLVPIAAYNYGAHKPDRIMGVFKAGVITAELFMLVGFLLFQFVPAELLGLFKPSEEMLCIGVPALRIISWSFLLAGYGIQTGSLLQALGHGMLSMWSSVIRQLVALVPFAWLLSRLGQLDLVWLSFPMAEIVSGVVITFFLIHVIKKQIRPMQEAANQEWRTA